MFYARLPQLMPIYASLVLNHFEIAVRSASTLGLVGAGGIGATLDLRDSGLPLVARVGIILLTVIATVFPAGYADRLGEKETPIREMNRISAPTVLKKRRRRARVLAREKGFFEFKANIISVAPFGRIFHDEARKKKW